MKIVFSAHGMYLDPEDDHDLTFLSEATTAATLSDINHDLVNGPPCGRLTEEEAARKILYVYTIYLKQIIWGYYENKESKLV